MKYVKVLTFIMMLYEIAYAMQSGVGSTVNYFETAIDFHRFVK